MNKSLRRSPLDAEHRALGAKMTEFGGWDMPIQYRSVLEEHRACREHAVVFDVSHLGSVRVAGPAAVPVLQWALTNDLGRIGPGRAQYTHLLDPDDAHVVDDIIVWWVDDDELLVMPNASNTEPIVSTLEGANDTLGGGCSVADITSTRAVLAVQGPEARAVLAKVSPEMADVPRFEVARVDWRGADCVVAGTGYTGEDGVEIHVPAEHAAALWRELVGAGVVPAGLGARDTLRLEAGLPLHGHELGAGITPLQAGLGWVVRFDKGDFRGRAPLLAERERGIARRLRGLLVDGRRPPRAGYPVMQDGAVIGEVTSGNFSPTLERAIALAFLPPEIEEGAPLAVEMRGTAVPATVVKPPFVKR
ncbi:MAG: glycine cleavage system aminomethyltransferase GcvT [Acidimicrobiia bacterium]